MQGTRASSGPQVITGSLRGVVRDGASIKNGRNIETVHGRKSII